ncbi:MAG TPA: hypothetical protein QF571_08660, partial [Desulfobacterales bacterium]|nr:hypothetical protein [Desulfobacterales bacterium]
HLTREEGVALVKRFDGESPDLYFKEVLDYVNIDANHFMDLCDEHRSPHLWEKRDDQWHLRRPVWSDY